MAEKSGFFNAVLSGGVYDRKYNANDYSDNLAVVISSGVLRSTNDDLKVTASGMVASVAAGRAWINGHYYNNDSTYTFTATTAPTGGSRWDRVVLRFTNELLGRKIYLVYLQGTEAATPTKPSITRTDTIYDLVLADIYMEANATSLTVTDTRSDTSVCGWVYSTSGDNSFFTSLDSSFNTWFQDKKDTLASVTLFQRLVNNITLQTSATSVSFSFTGYDATTDFLEVYINGILDRRYTVSGTVISFVDDPSAASPTSRTLTAGTLVTIYCFRSVDTTGIQTVVNQVAQLQTQMAQIQGTNKFVYTCTGTDDNISISQIAQAFYTGSYTASSVTTAANAFLTALGGNTYLAALSSSAQMEIEVVGDIGIQSAAAGSGTATSRYRWFDVGLSEVSNKKLILDFAKCQRIAFACPTNTGNIVFYGTDLYIRNANITVVSSGVSSSVMVSGSSIRNGYVDFKNCRFEVSCSGEAIIAENGTFDNCTCTVRSTADNAICFNVKNVSIVRLIGGAYRAYIGDSSKVSAVAQIESTETNAVFVATNINAPTVALTGYTQRNLIIASGGAAYINGVVSTMTSTGTTATIQGQIWKSKR